MAMYIVGKISIPIPKNLRSLWNVIRVSGMLLVNFNPISPKLCKVVKKYLSGDEEVYWAKKFLMKIKVNLNICPFS